MFELRNICKSFGAVLVLDGVSLSIPAGQTTVLLGPSGCGKSTLLRIMIGLIYPDSGEAQFEGKLIRPQTIREQRRRMGYVVQDGGLFPHFTCSQNVTVDGASAWLVARAHRYPARRTYANSRDFRRKRWSAIRWKRRRSTPARSA